MKYGLAVLPNFIKKIISTSKMDKPLVSICCITYNHEKYIKQCIDGFLVQKTSFDFEILIYDDASNDGTSEIIKSYQLNYPNLIKPIINEINQYSLGIRGIFAKYTFNRAKGKYIAICEGDDYWTDPLKLQKQVDFLEENQDYSMCFHNALFKYETKNYTINQIKIKDKDYTSDELLKNWVVPTASIIFNKNLFNFNYFNSNYIVNGDIFIVLISAEVGNVRGFKDVMSTYRIQNKGLSISRLKNSQLKLYLSYINHYKYIKTSFSKVSKSTINTKIFYNYMNIYSYLKDQKKINRYKYLLLAFYYKPIFFLNKLVKK